jgi:hypothetical protein
MFDMKPATNVLEEATQFKRQFDIYCLSLLGLPIDIRMCKFLATATQGNPSLLSNQIFLRHPNMAAS